MSKTQMIKFVADYAWSGIVTGFAASVGFVITGKHYGAGPGIAALFLPLLIAIMWAHLGYRLGERCKEQDQSNAV